MGIRVVCPTDPFHGNSNDRNDWRIFFDQFSGEAGELFQQLNLRSNPTISDRLKNNLFTAPMVPSRL